MDDIAYARTPDGLHIAYRVVGAGPVDIVVPEPFTLVLEVTSQIPVIARFLHRLGAIGRVILFDPRGIGLSDRPLEDDLPTLESRMGDVIAVMDAVASPRAVFFGFSDAGTLGILFAATYPERTLALVLHAASAAVLQKPDYLIGWTEAQWAEWLEDMEARWGQQAWVDEDIKWAAPSLAGDDQFRRTWASVLRLGASPGTAVAVNRMIRDTDVRGVLPAVHVPTLVLNRRDNRVTTTEETRYVAERISGARLVELDGADHMPWAGDVEALLGEVESFVRSVRDDEALLDRVLATVLCTDIVRSTERAAASGDDGWRKVVSEHDRTVRSLLSRYRGHEVKTLGDGFLATFDGPARGARCALAIAEHVRALGIDVRAGLHTGELEVVPGDIRGLAVTMATRIAALAGPGEVLVSRTVKELAAGSGLAFDDRGAQLLKGIPDECGLYAVSNAPSDRAA